VAGAEAGEAIPAVLAAILARSLSSIRRSFLFAEWFV
jgi:hypothetical protein